MGLAVQTYANKHLQCSLSKASGEKLFHSRKPEPDDSISLKERFIYAKVILRKI